MPKRRLGLNPLSVDDNVANARMFHLARGVLVRLLRRPPEQVLNELIDVARRFGLSPFALARALVAATVRQCWAVLLEPIASERY
jgi:hypothetical protein